MPGRTASQRRRHHSRELPGIFQRPCDSRPPAHRACLRASGARPGNLWPETAGRAPPGRCHRTWVRVVSDERRATGSLYRHSRRGPDLSPANTAERPSRFETYLPECSPARSGTRAVDFVGGDHLGDEKLAWAVQEVFLRSWGTKPQEEVRADLHGVTSSEASPRGTEIVVDVREQLEDCLAAVMSLGERGEIGQAHHLPAVGAHPHALDTLHIVLDEATVEREDRESAQLLEHIALTRGERLGRE